MSADLSAAGALGLTLAVACALAWAGLDAMRKRLSAAVTPLALLVLLNTALLPVFAAWWAFTGGTVTDLEAYAVPASLVLVLQIIANVLFLSALRASPLSLTIPFLGLTPAFATLVGVVVLGERPSTIQLVGVGLVVFGALLLGSAPPSGQAGNKAGSGGASLLGALIREPGARMMCGVALCWAVTMSLDKQALRHAALPIHALVELGGVLLAALAYLAARGRLTELKVGRPQWRDLGVAALIFALAFALQLSVIQIVPVAVVETIKRAIGFVSAVVIGRWWFAERVSAVTIIAVVVIVIGVAAVML